MTNKDVFKILLCSYGYDRNIKIETTKNEFSFLTYDIYAENKEGDSYHEYNSGGLMFNVYLILDYMKKNKVHFESRWWRENGKDVLDDNTRISLTASWDKIDIKNKRWQEAYEPIKKWEEQNNPCINCIIKKYHPDSIHYNCEYNHTHSCNILLEYYKNVLEKRKAIDNNNTTSRTIMSLYNKINLVNHQSRYIL